MTLLKRYASIVAFVLLSLAGGLAPVRQAHAGVPTIDVANMVQNVMTATQTLRSNVNEAMALANQMTQISNELRNLQAMPAQLANQLLGQYVGQYQQLTAAFRQINGLSQDIPNLVNRFQQVFPDRSIGNMAPRDILAQTRGWINQSRQTALGVYGQTGRIMDQLPQQQQQVFDIVLESQNSSGAVSATQANTQMGAQIATQLMQLNAMTATLAQAQTDMMAQQLQGQDVARRRAIDSRADWANRSNQPPAANLPVLR